MRRALLVAIVALVFAPTASAKCLEADRVLGAAPLTVTFTACEPTHWDFGDGTSADGASVTHTFAVGRWAVSAAGGSILVTSEGVSLRAPALVGYRHRLTFRGTIEPRETGKQVVLLRDGAFFASTTTRTDGTFRITRRIASPGPYAVRYDQAASAPVSTTVKPELTARLVGSGTIGAPLAVVAQVRPAAAGTVHVRVYRGSTLLVDRDAARVALATASPRTYRIVVTTTPAAGFAARSRTLGATVAQPTLQSGSRGASVRALEQRLHELRYALRGIDGYFGTDDYDAVVAFQKVNGLPRTGRVTRALWNRLARASVPRARYRGNHVEVDKTRQVLFEVRDGKVALVVAVSTGATGNTPLGLWHVYRRVPGWSWVLWYPTFFIRGFAIHGYPEVPAYPASHGCVRVPMWVAPRLYGMHPDGFSIYIYI